MAGASFAGLTKEGRQMTNGAMAAEFDRLVQRHREPLL